MSLRCYRPRHGDPPRLALIVHADNTVMSCTDDDERDGCRGRDLRHEGDLVRCWEWALTGCNYCGVQRASIDTGPAPSYSETSIALGALHVLMRVLDLMTHDAG